MFFYLCLTIIHAFKSYFYLKPYYTAECDRVILRVIWRFNINMR